MGSVRAVVNTAGVVSERNDYYPFGLRHTNAALPISAANRFKFNGKEEQVAGNLALLDYGARMYDNVLGRWFVQDSLAEKHYSLSSYSYTFNNPILFIDPDGNDPRKAMQLFNESISGKATLGFQAGVSFDLNGKSLGLGANLGSGTIAYKEQGEGIKWGEGNVAYGGADMGYGVFSVGVEQEVKDNGDGTALRTTETEGSFLIFSGAYVEKEKVNTKTGWTWDKTESFEVKSEVSVKAAAVLGVEVEINIPKFLEGLDELFNK